MVNGRMTVLIQNSEFGIRDAAHPDVRARRPHHNCVAAFVVRASRLHISCVNMRAGYD